MTGESQETDFWRSAVMEGYEWSGGVQEESRDLKVKLKVERRELWKMVKTDSTFPKCRR